MISVLKKRMNKQLVDLADVDVMALKYDLNFNIDPAKKFQKVSFKLPGEEVFLFS